MTYTHTLTLPYISISNRNFCITAESVQTGQIVAGAKLNHFYHGPHGRRPRELNLCFVYYYLHFRCDGNAIVRQKLHRLDHYSYTPLPLPPLPPCLK